MIKSRTDFDARFWKIIDLDTGDELPKVIWANDATGEFKQYTNNGGVVYKEGNIKLIDIRNYYKPSTNISKCIKLD
jgi:hypothetical protein